MNEAFTKPVAESEILQALHQMNNDKTPGPDGLTAGFYEDHWPSIGKEVVIFVQTLF